VPAAVRRKIVALRLCAEEYEILKRAAAAGSCNVSEFARGAILERASERGDLRSHLAVLARNLYELGAEVEALSAYVSRLLENQGEPPGGAADG
jgi:hypothetical protein